MRELLGILLLIIWELPKACFFKSRWIALNRVYQVPLLNLKTFWGVNFNRETTEIPDSF